MKKALILLPLLVAACGTPQVEDPQVVAVVLELDSMALRLDQLKDTIDLTDFATATARQPVAQNLRDSLALLQTDSTDRAFWIDRLGRIDRCERAFRKGGSQEDNYRKSQVALRDELIKLARGLENGDLLLDSISEDAGQTLYLAHRLEMNIRGTYMELGYCLPVSDTALPSARILLNNMKRP